MIKPGDLVWVNQDALGAFAAPRGTKQLGGANARFLREGTVCLVIAQLDHSVRPHESLVLFNDGYGWVDTEFLLPAPPS